MSGMRSMRHRTVSDDAEAIYTDELRSYIGVETPTRRPPDATRPSDTAPTEWVVGDVHTNSLSESTIPSQMSFPSCLSMTFLPFQLVVTSTVNARHGGSKEPCGTLGLGFSTVPPRGPLRRGVASPTLSPSSLLQAPKSGYLPNTTAAKQEAFG